MTTQPNNQFFQPIPALVGFLDNYIWYRSDGLGNALVVDPGEAGPVIERFEREGLTPTVILVTHHHFDHVDGIAPLLERYPGAAVYGPEKTPLASITHRFTGGETLSLPAFDLHCKVIATPGHTLDHICYYSAQDNWLLSGDTLFSAGCGRMFEGTAEQFFQSLQCLADLPAETELYAAHEYTAANIRFAKAVEPTNEALLDYEQKVTEIRGRDEPSLPSTIGIELQVNPFVRAGNDAVVHAAMEHRQSDKKPHTKDTVTTAADSFAILRAWKDNF